ncbi:AraC family transcriptional regulator [Cellulomonas humilata]|uniref:AraC family transcriptional regulator n=1 Tax=Cellulomonas humilata TaxID=144055 RepID=A0A7Y6A2U4_9CELL|nr:AraC family transcriptional regulator [Cellulomonas humilata]NUU18706.1 AraC family transcriptional regulator [Cellulomonas humilata]
MDESPTGPDEFVREGFAGQRMLVVPRPAVERALSHPVTGKLFVTDAGFFPHASRHGRERPVGAAEHVLLVCTDGSGWCTTGRATVPVGRGDAVLLRARQPHAYGASEADPWTLWWLHVLGTDSGDLVDAAREAAGGPVTHLRDAAPVASLVAQVIDALDEGTTTTAFIRSSGSAWHALAHITATGRRTPGPGLSPVERAAEHLRATSPRRTSAHELAAMVGLSPSQLNALFRRHVGASPLEYQTQLRMARARELLDSSALSIASVARTAGYDDPLYFSRQFTAVHGMPPRAYRARPTGA